MTLQQVSTAHNSAGPVWVYDMTQTLVMAAPQNPRSREELAAVWRIRLDKAKAAYDLAVAEFRRSAEEYRVREGESSVDDRAFREAVEAESAARQHYLEVLQTFTELIVN